MHKFSIHFISFTAQIYNALHMQGRKSDFGHLGGMAPFPPPSLVNPLTTQMH